MFFGLKMVFLPYKKATSRPPFRFSANGPNKVILSPKPYSRKCTSPAGAYRSTTPYAEAAKWYWLAANRGNAKAQFNLGVMYAKGQGVPQDYAEAAKWYRLTADQGYAGAQNNLGYMYANGQGVPQDFVSAHMWLDLCAAQGSQAAAKDRDAIAQRMTPAQIAEARKLARDWKPTAQPISTSNSPTF